MVKHIYCGTDDYADFLTEALERLSIICACRTYYIDGEAWLEVRF